MTRDCRLDAISNLRQIALAVLMYQEDHHGAMPDSRDMPALKACLHSYLETPNVFVDPCSGSPYLIFHGRAAAKAAGRLPVVPLLYEANSAGRTTRLVLFVNGDVRPVDQSAWSRLLRAFPNQSVKTTKAITSDDDLIFITAS